MVFSEFSLPRTFKQLVSYGLAGIVGTLVHYLVLVLLVELIGFGAVAASGAGFVFGAIINHELNRRFAFSETTRGRAETSAWFGFFALVGFFVNMTMMHLLVNGLQIYYMLAQLFATATVFLLTFLANKVWTFQV